MCIITRFDLCGMHMRAGRLIKHQKTDSCDQNTQMRWRSRDVAIASRCEGAMFNFTG